MDQETPPGTGAPDGEGRPDQSRGSRLQSWQTLLAAVITAAAAVIGILLTKGSDSETPPIKSTTEIRQEAYITKARSGPHPKLPSPAVTWHLEGTFKNLEPGTAVVGLLGPEMAAGNGERWVVANAVLDRSRGTWTVDLRLRRPAKSIAYQVGTASEDLWKGCTAETECLAGPSESSPSESSPTDQDLTAEPPPEPEPSGEADEGTPESPVDGITPTTPLTDTRTGQEYSSPPPGQD
ncbi:hypothetical protein ABZY16_29975 [Streptomyces sp. NPDC006553]|uniref:hypothetical protein n=1 Tax=Streptomyces sp. NPDC006553 TaxID=3157180 RepID=UPI0033B91F1E